MWDAVVFGDAEAARRLIKAGHDPNEPIRIAALETTPLILAIEDGELDLAKALIEGGAHLDARDTRGQTALFKAARDGHAKSVKWLLEQGARPDLRDMLNRTARDHAEHKGHTAIADMLAKAERAGS